MTEEQLSALLAKLNEDAGLKEKLKGAADLDAAVAMAQEAGFDVSKADWLKYQARQVLELSDDELERAVGGMQLGKGSHVGGHGFCVWQIADTGEQRAECVGISSAICTVNIRILGGC